MRYRKQSRMACLAYALWQIDAVSEAAVREYEQEKLFEGWELAGSWLAKHVSEPDFLASLRAQARYPPSGAAPTLEGKGLVLLGEISGWTTHTISYEDGIVLDPSISEKRLSLEAYLRLYPYWKVLRILPIKQP